MHAKNNIKKAPTNSRGAGKTVAIEGTVKGKRVSSHDLEAQIQSAITKGARKLTVKAQGQHGIGGRIWPEDGAGVSVTVEGTAGQRLGSMGTLGTGIVVKGSASDDVGWINCGAQITVLGDVTNGAHNAAAQGKLYVQGSGGARCDTMTKANPKFDPPESWYFRNVGDSFAEFKAGGIAVICGVNPRNPESVLGYRPCVGMVGGTIYFRGKAEGFSKSDVKVSELSAEDFKWLTKNIKPYLKAIKKLDHLDELTSNIGDWKKIVAYTPAERTANKGKRKPMSEFAKNSWEDGVGDGGIFAPYLSHDTSLLPYITTGEQRRNKPMWNNTKYSPPCAYNCPTGIPSHKRATLIRHGKTKEALELVLNYSPLPATVCGEVCPNLCMTACTRGQLDTPLNIKEYGRLALELEAPKPAASTGNTIAIIGGGPAGMSAAWQLALKGHAVDIYEAEEKIGGKLELAIPRERLPEEILQKEISRFKEIGVNVHAGKPVDKKLFNKLYKSHDLVVVASGAHSARMIPFAGSGDVMPGIEFLKNMNYGNPPSFKGKRVVIIGAGNVGMDVALQAWDCNAKSVTAIDVQKPAAFGKELDMAESLGTKLVWPRFTEKFDKKKKKLFFKDGTQMDADVVIMSIGEVPVLDFLPQSVNLERGQIVVDDKQQTSDSKVFAIGDVTRPGLVTHAIGHGRTVADVIHAELMDFDYMSEVKELIPHGKIKQEYYEGGRGDVFTPSGDANACMSCGACRDCHMCEASCYAGAITRIGTDDGMYEYVVDESKCIGCSFCAHICPCGVWDMELNL